MKKEGLMGWGCMIGLSGSVAFLVLSGGGAKQKKYQEETKPLCYKAMELFDEDKDGVLDSEESIKLAKSVGYGIFPTKYITAKLLPWSLDKEDIMLEVSGHYGEEAGWLTHNLGEWKETHRFPKSKLIDIVRRHQNR